MKKNNTTYAILINIMRACYLVLSTLLIFYAFMYGNKSKVKVHVDTSLQPIKKEVVILWDIHDVILEKDFKKILHIFWQEGLRFELFKKLNFKLIGRLLKLFYKRIVDDATGEQFVVAAQQAGNEPLATFIKNLANAQRPIDGMVEIIAALDALGYRLHIGSNIGNSVYQDLVTTSDLAYIFKHFELNYSHVVTYVPGQEVIKKPDKRYYLAYLEKTGLTPDQVLFIDDRIKNIETACKLGMHTILFKNVKQLKHDLEILLAIKLPSKQQRVALASE